MKTVYNWLFGLTVFCAVFAYTGIASSLELDRTAVAISDETDAEEKASEETKAEEKADETENSSDE